MAPQPASSGHTTASRPPGWTRRSVLAGAAATGVLAVGGGVAGAAAGETPQTAIVPAVEEFEGNFAGQFLTIEEPAAEADASPDAVHDACDVPWPRDATDANVGQLSDRRSDSPVAVRLPVYMDGRQVDLVEDALFVVSSVTECQGDYVRVDLSWVTTRSIVGKPAGPTVSGDEQGAAEADEEATETPGASGDGFGLLVAIVGAAGGLLARRRRDE